MAPAETARGAVGADQGVDRGAPFPRLIGVLMVQAAIIAVAGSFIHVPMHSVAPGSTLNVLSEVEVRGGETFESEGQLLLTTASVSSAPLTLWEGVAVWLHPGIATIPRAFLVPPGTTDEGQDVQNRHDIEESKITAAVAAFRALGFEVPVLPGVEVVTVIDGFPAEEALKPGDRIAAVDGVRLTDRASFSRAMQGVRPGDEITLMVERRGRERTISLTTAEVDDRPFIGITLGPPYRFPNDVRIDSGDVVGPSGGLVFALSIADAFTREDLTRGHTIGVTGIIELDDRGRGVVRQIGAVKEKVRGAHRDGADVFIVPGPEEEEARSVAPSGMTVIGVRTLAQAIDSLRALEPVAR